MATSNDQLQKVNSDVIFEKVMENESSKFRGNAGTDWGPVLYTRRLYVNLITKQSFRASYLKPIEKIYYSMLKVFSKLKIPTR